MPVSVHAVCSCEKYDVAVLIVIFIFTDAFVCSLRSDRLMSVELLIVVSGVE